MNRLQTASSTLPLFTLAAALALALSPARAADPAADKQWHGNVSIGGALASGNSTSSTLAAAADASKTTADDKISLYGLGNYASSKVNGVKTTSADSLRLGGRYDYNLSPVSFLFGSAEGETNKAAGLDSRLNLALGGGYKIINTESTSFNVFAGVGSTKLKYSDGSSKSGAQFQFGEESTHKLSATTSFKQRLVASPGSGQVGSLTTFDASLATAIAGGWTLNTGLQARHATKLPPGIKASTTLLTVGFGYKY